jgi:hypothetical protein
MLPGKRCEISAEAWRRRPPGPREGPRDKPAGGACTRDGECKSVFCDRGTCAEPQDKPPWECIGYSCQCPYDSVPIASDDPRIRGDRAAADREGCAGYVCIGLTCRSCVSDEECQKGASDYKCLAYEGQPGKRCGNPSHALRDPKLPQPKL